jgi:hypothetical protein
MNKGPVICLICGALVYESFHGHSEHAEYNVPAPTVQVGNMVPMSNVQAYVIYSTNNG